MNNVTNTITVTGLVATSPRYLSTAEGLDIISFRLASQQGEGATRFTNWYTVTGFHSIARHGVESINKGDRVIVVGSFRLRDWENTDRAGTVAEIEAQAIGHDMTWGRSTQTRSSASELGFEVDDD